MEQLYLYDIMTDEIRSVNIRRVTPLFAEGTDGTSYLSSHYVWAKDRRVLEVIRETAKGYADLWSWDAEAGGILVRFAREDDCYGEDLEVMLFEPCEYDGQVSVRISCYDI